MEPKTLGDHQKLLTEVIKKQIVILGPDITLTKARNVAGLTVADDGTVMEIHGDPQMITKELVNQFMELSGLIVKKTMEPLLSLSVDGATTPLNSTVITDPLSIPSTPPNPPSSMNISSQASISSPEPTQTPLSKPLPESSLENPSPSPVVIPDTTPTSSVTPPSHPALQQQGLATPSENMQQSNKG